MASRRKRYIDNDVLTEAKVRLHHVMDMFDSWSVSFSGGKDSLVVLHLTHEVMQERGDDRPVPAMFYDEELVPSTVIDFVDRYRREPWVDLTWLAVPLKSEKYLFGQTYSYVQWDPRREHVRPKPPWATTQETLGWPTMTLSDQTHIENLTGKMLPGRVAVLNGIRAAESPMRLYSSARKVVENYINVGQTPKTSFVKPIFDWERNDVFRYFYDRGIDYAPVYDRQMFAGMKMRVSTPLHAESAMRFHKLREVDPTFYDQVMDVFPEMSVQERYGNDLDKDRILAEYGQDWDGVERYIREKFTDRVMAAKARVVLREGRKYHERYPEAYPVDHVARQIINGAVKRGNIMPIPKSEQDRRRRKYEKENAS